MAVFKSIGCNRFGVVIATLLCHGIPTSWAKDSIPANYRHIAAEHRLPADVLYSVAITESGQKLRSGKLRPWPWTLNVAGKALRYPTRLAAWRGLTEYLQQGVDLIDIGIMQVNWRYHREQLGSPWQALEPFHNTRTGARILKREHQKTGTWKTAIGHYHSPGSKPKQQERAQHYTQRVVKRMAQLRSE
ncbi:transglycosylase SLT domain-containing protein [Methylomonas methanica]|uniref:Lytic transglycosylase catalytic n=1 Tax=Methylomonas methanica (strain DSM 25384 / MC09) TaxID=857087 RepID=G0A582_METMM|nr:transglycosylase SLT domain-containing protein [Methylomonas methanica]AEG00412.1 Lytic transglycosylase catalytic [Methylomonas methanica MC09]